MVEVSIPSRRVGLESNSSFQACFASFARTFTSNPLCEVAQDPLRDFVRSSVAAELPRQLAVLRKHLAGAVPGHLGGHRCDLVAKALLGLLLLAAALLEVLPVRLDRVPQ